MSGRARIIWNEKGRRGRKEPNCWGYTVNKFRKELKRQKIQFTETHHRKGRYKKFTHPLSHLSDREVVVFKW